VQNFRRHAEPCRNDAGAKAARHDHVPIVFDDVAVSEARTVARRHELRPDERHADLSAMGMTGERQRDAPRYLRENVGLVDQEHDRVIGVHVRERARQIVGAEATKQQLGKTLGGGETPALLFGACHGVGFPQDDDRLTERQGALVCQDWPGPQSEEGVDQDQYFTAQDVTDGASLHGLVAFFFACYGLGTPERDNFAQQTLGKAERIAPRPLVARLPQRLLSHPRGGALAVVGHIDRAWSTSFQGSAAGEGIDPFRNCLRRLLNGHTVAWAMEFFNQSYAFHASELGNLWEAALHREDVDEELLALLWKSRNDARNFAIFGDPAVRLVGAPAPRR